VIPETRCNPIVLRELHEPSPYDLYGLLESARKRLLDGSDPGRVVDVLSDGLWWMRYLFTAERWREITSIARAHPLASLLHEDPLTRRAFAKPRGYSGDASLLDLIYCGERAADLNETSPLGLAILNRNIRSPASMAIRECRDFMAALIDHIAEVKPQPCILAAACGHLREGLLSRAVQQRRLGRLVALDRDADALALVERDLASLCVETVNRDVQAITEEIFPPSSFDLIYATGLYDYIPEDFARSLTKAFFELLKPGGRLVISNPVQNAYDVGYIEVFGDWFKIYRSASELMDLAAPIDPLPIAMRRVYTRCSQDLFYLEVRKRITSVS
jgi:extracellular factor (EF) 3-hydroxypalmitic acid methyl ester biosynthesis protein